MPFALRISYGPWSSGTRIEVPGEKISLDCFAQPIIFPDGDSWAIDPRDIVQLRSRVYIYPLDE